jgi:hypothetical protein
MIRWYLHRFVCCPSVSYKWWKNNLDVMTAVNFLTILTMWKLNLCGHVYFPSLDYWSATSLCVSDTNCVIVIRTSFGTFQIILARKSQDFFTSSPISPQYYEHQLVTHMRILALANEYHLIIHINFWHPE